MSNTPEFQLKHFQAQIPKRYRQLQWKDLTAVDKQSMEFAQDYIEIFPNNDPQSIYLWSKVSGNGKTGYSVCLVRDLIAKGKIKNFACYFSYLWLLDKLRQDKDESFSTSVLFDQIRRASFIIFDDIGVERLNPSVAERYYFILNHLWDDAKPSIFTSKFTLNELCNRADESVDIELLDSIGSRLSGMCGEQELTNGEDFRVRNR